MKQILNVTSKPKKEKIFFGEFSGVYRVDEVSHEVAKTLKEKSEGHTWFSKEVNYKGDKTGFIKKLNEDTKRAFKLNIVYQTLMDSGVTGGLTAAIYNATTSSIWRLLYTRIIGEEAIHAESYSYGLNEVFGSKATEIIDLIYSDKHVQKRMDKENELLSKCYNRVVEMNNKGTFTNPTDEDKEMLIELIYAIYFLESIKFPFSFLITFIINNSNEDAIPGFTRAIRLIANDELNVHVPTDINIINILKKDSNQGFTKVIKNPKLQKKLNKLLYDTVDQEIEWAEYLLKDMKVKGITYELAVYFIKHQAYIRGNAVGLDVKKYKDFAKSNDLIDWFNNYKDIDMMNTAPQESTPQSYTRGLEDDLNKLDSKKK